MRETQVRSLDQEDPPREGNGNPLQYSFSIIRPTTHILPPECSLPTFVGVAGCAGVTVLSCKGLSSSYQGGRVLPRNRRAQLGLLARAAVTSIFSLAPRAHLPGFPLISLGPPRLLYSSLLPWAASLPSLHSVFPEVVSSRLPLPPPLDHLMWEHSFLKLLKFQDWPHIPDGLLGLLGCPSS